MSSLTQDARRLLTSPTLNNLISLTSDEAIFTFNIRVLHRIQLFRNDLYFCLIASCNQALCKKFYGCFFLIFSQMKQILNYEFTLLVQSANFRPTKFYILFKTRETSAQLHLINISSSRIN